MDLFTIALSEYDFELVEDEQDSGEPLLDVGWNVRFDSPSAMQD